MVQLLSDSSWLVGSWPGVTTFSYVRASWLAEAGPADPSVCGPAEHVHVGAPLGRGCWVLAVLLLGRSSTAHPLHTCKQSLAPLTHTLCLAEKYNCCLSEGVQMNTRLLRGELDKQPSLYRMPGKVHTRRCTACCNKRAHTDAPFITMHDAYQASSNSSGTQNTPS